MRIELRADDDELVFAQVLEYAKRTALGEPVSFTFYELCQDLGWSINGRYYTKAEECLSRLQATAMGFTSDRVGHLESVSLLHRFRVLAELLRHRLHQLQLHKLKHRRPNQLRLSLQSQLWLSQHQ